MTRLSTTYEYGYRMERLESLVLHRLHAGHPGTGKAPLSLAVKVPDVGSLYKISDIRHCLITESKQELYAFQFKIDIPSVTIPNVPSAPIKSFVVSNPVEDFRALRRVLITSPSGNTTVFEFAENHAITINKISMYTSRE